MTPQDECPEHGEKLARSLDGRLMCPSGHFVDRSPQDEDHEHRCQYESDAEGDLACPVCGRYADDGDEAADSQGEDHEAGIEAGDRVRLSRNGEMGTVDRTYSKRAVVKWDSGGESHPLTADLSRCPSPERDTVSREAYERMNDLYLKARRERDTEKLVEALREIRDIAGDNDIGALDACLRIHRYAREALAEFTAPKDDETSEEER